MPTTNKEREMRIAQRRVEGFAQQFGEAHRNLARHAAFPLVLTPDLLYQIWAKFVPEAPWTAVAHVLLSRLCRQVGYETYEMDISDRNLLLRELKEEFGQERFDELGDFLLDYVAQALVGDDPDTQDLAQAQEWTALAYTKPDEAARELAEILSLRIKEEDIAEVFRLAPLVETFAEPLLEAGYEPLLVYARGMSHFVRGNRETALEEVSKLGVSSNGQIIIVGVNVEIPEKMFMQSSELEKIVYNLVILGRTGAGKSALINYLYGDSIAKTGIGKPVTEKGFDKSKLTWKSIPINIYDSWGLEVGQDKNWMNMLNNELKEHGTDRPVSEWFHTIFYCINAATTRIEPFEFTIIQDLITNKYRVIIVLTRAELMSEESLSTLKDCIRKDVLSEIPIIEVCNVAQKTRMGETQTFGKQELQNETLRGFWNGITIRLPERCEYVLHQEVDKWREEQEQYLNSTKTDFRSTFKQSEIKKTIENNYRSFLMKLKDTRYEIIVGEVKKIVTYYKQLVEILDYPPPEDLPVFTLENEKLISDTFLERIVGLLEQAEQSYFRIIANLLKLVLPDKRQLLQLEITRFCNDLKKEITRQKPEISKLIEKIRRDTV